MKKTAAVFMSILFSLAASLGMAQTSTKSSTKKWDPTDKPAAVSQKNKKAFVLYDKNGKQVNLDNKADLAGVILHDKEGNNYQLKDGKIIQLSPEKTVKQRVGPGIVA